MMNYGARVRYVKGTLRRRRNRIWDFSFVSVCVRRERAPVFTLYLCVCLCISNLVCVSARVYVCLCVRPSVFVSPSLCLLCVSVCWSGVCVCVRVLVIHSHFLKKCIRLFIICQYVQNIIISSKTN